MQITYLCCSMKALLAGLNLLGSGAVQSSLNIGDLSACTLMGGSDARFDAACALRFSLFPLWVALDRLLQMG